MSRVRAAELKLLTDLIEERFGLTFEGVRLEILESRLQPRLRELHLDLAARLLPVPPLPSRPRGRARPTAGDGHEQRDLFLPRDPPVRAAGEPRGSRAPRRRCSGGRSGSSRPAAPRARSRTRSSIALQNAGLELAGITWEIDALRPQRRPRSRGPSEALYEDGSLRACDADARRRYFSPRAAAVPTAGAVPEGRPLLPGQPAGPEGRARLGACTTRSSAATC